MLNSYLIITVSWECNNYESVEGQDQAIYRCLLATTKMSDAICSILIILLSDLFKETIHLEKNKYFGYFLAC